MMPSRSAWHWHFAVSPLAISPLLFSVAERENGVHNLLQFLGDAMKRIYSAVLVWISLAGFIVFPCLFSAGSVRAQAAGEAGNSGPGSDSSSWSFAASGDSRNCGDLVMPAIAAGVKQAGASFYWHLGDFRAIYTFDEDIQHQPEHLAKPLTIIGYEQTAWDDFIDSQLVPFSPVPVFLGIGNHDTIPPMTRDKFIQEFADWLDSPVLQTQRLRDDPRDHKLKTYYHWIERGVDFINLDNATDDQFDSAQLHWLRKVLDADSRDPSVHTVIAAMHEALPESISSNHSMNQSAQGTESGRLAYHALLRVQNEAHKYVYVLASHSHYFMDGIFNTDYWRSNGGVLPGWIVGTAGAVRYPLPKDSANARASQTNIYGFLLGTVRPNGEATFAFHPVNESDVPGSVVDRYTPGFVHWCFAENSEAK
jgi:hypothetical protein